MTCDVLNLEWSSSGRDREVATALGHTLRRRGYDVIEASVFDYAHLLLKHRPRLLYVADPVGARINYDAVLCAERMGIPSISVEAEGNYTDDRDVAVAWGHVADRDLHEQVKLQWSTRARQALLRLAPELSGRLLVTGAVGFDRYRLGTFATADDWRRRYGFEHRRVVGFATWAFDLFYGDEERVAHNERRVGAAAADRFRADRDALRVLLRELIERHPETMFVLKEHPGVVSEASTEIAGLEGLDNVLRIKHEEPIADCISVCDVWMAYESTTCLEAWLLDTPTLLINPSGGDFPRSDLHRGAPVLETLGTVDAALRAHAETGGIPAFDAKAEGRSGVLADTLQWVDGKNHLRAAHYMEQLLRQSPARRPSASLRVRAAARLRHLLFLGAGRLPALPGFRNYAAARRRFTTQQLAEEQRRVAAMLDGVPGQLSPQELAELEGVNR